MQFSSSLVVACCALIWLSGCLGETVTSTVLVRDPAQVALLASTDTHANDPAQVLLDAHTKCGAHVAFPPKTGAVRWCDDAQVDVGDLMLISRDGTITLPNSKELDPSLFAKPKVRVPFETYKGKHTLAEGAIETPTDNIIEVRQHREPIVPLWWSFLWVGAGIGFGAYDLASNDTTEGKIDNTPFWGTALLVGAVPLMYNVANHILFGDDRLIYSR